MKRGVLRMCKKCQAVIAERNKTVRKLQETILRLHEDFVELQSEVDSLSEELKLQYVDLYLDSPPPLPTKTP